MATKNFKDAYAVLQQHAQTLRNQNEPNIDDLLTIVTESVSAYKICQERIDAVEKALGKALNDTGVNAISSAVPREAATTTKTPAQESSHADDADVPF